MVERTRIGIIYQNNENWIGGTYYIQNLVYSLNKLEDHKKPHLVIICETEKEFLQLKNSGYPYISWHSLGIRHQSLNLYKKVVNKVYNKLTRFDLHPQNLYLDFDKCSIIFPAPVGLKTINKAKNIYWIPDFQEQILPHFFSETEIRNRTQSHRLIAQTNDSVLFSSEDAFKTFEQLFPDSKAEKHILRFAVNHSKDYQDLDLEALKQKYQVCKNYFFAPNQFWKHKNQIVVLQALNRLKEQGVTEFMVVFSGKEYDYRNPDYFKSLKQFVEDHQLQNQTRFLGFIDRNEQLKLMSGALAIIQPSLFEGWSTVVEDAKALNQWIIASDLPVHREQLQFNVDFFEPGNDEVLAAAIAKGIKEGFQKRTFDYEKYIMKFAQDFIKIVDSVIS